jgi:hypothetical protein
MLREKYGGHATTTRQSAPWLGNYASSEDSGSVKTRKTSKRKLGPPLPNPHPCNACLCGSGCKAPGLRSCLTITLVHSLVFGLPSASVR